MSEFILYLIVVLFALVCVVMLLAILLQSGKGGGLSSLGSGAGSALTDSLGASSAEKTLVKATWWAAGIFMVLALVLTLWGAHVQRTGGFQIGAPPVSSAPAAAAGAKQKKGADKSGKAEQPAQDASESAPAAAAGAGQAAPAKSGS